MALKIQGIGKIKSAIKPITAKVKSRITTVDKHFSNPPAWWKLSDVLNKTELDKAPQKGNGKPKAVKNPHKKAQEKRKYDYLDGGVEDQATTKELVTAFDANLETLSEGWATGLAPFDFQITGARWLTGRTRALLADDMGLGKTVQSLIALPKNAAALVVCPASVQRNWVKEVNMWRPDLIPIELNRKSFRWPEPGEVLIARWSSLPIINPNGCTHKGKHNYRCWSNALPKKPKHRIYAIGDEIHYSKSPLASRSKSFRAISRAVDVSWGMSGTPLANKPEDLWHVLKSIGRIHGAVARSMMEYNDLFFYNIHTGRAFGAKAELKERISRVMLRRKKQEVLKDLPPKRYGTISVPLDKKELRKVLDEALVAAGGAAHVKAALRGSLEAMESLKVETCLAKARNLLAEAKIAKLHELLNDYQEAEEKVVVFSCHRKPVLSVSERPGWGRIIGGDNRNKKQTAIDAFQNGELEGMAITTAGAEGITLTAAATLLRIDLDWRVGTNAQVEDRLCRIGQDRSVLILDLVANHEIDEIVHNVILDKIRVLDQAGLGMGVEVPA